jgi:hypothetical protein
MRNRRKFWIETRGMGYLLDGINELWRDNDEL